MPETRRWLLAWLLFMCLTSSGLAAARDVRFLAIVVNQAATDVVAPVLFVDEEVYLTPDNFERIRVRLPDAPALEHQGARYYPLDTYEGTEHRVDERRQAIYLTIDPRFMLPTVIDRSNGALIEPSPTDFGGFLNYDILAERVIDEEELAGQFELGIFAGGLVGTTTQAVRNIDDDAEYVRLESTIVHDRPDELRTYRFGDSISVGGAWGRPVRFGGIQFGTNFATQPSFVSFPTANLSGDSALPSSVDILVNDSQRFSEDLPAGPFEIENVPVVTGAGEVTAVVTDILGRETVISQPYYASPTLLREGLNDFSYEAGFLREDFSVESFDYDDTPFFSGTHRYGLSDSLTTELRGELDANRQALGFALAAPVRTSGILSGAVAGAQEGDDRGGLFQLGFERQALDLSLSAFGRVTTGDYRDFGVGRDVRSPDAETRFSIGIPMEEFGSISGSYSFQAFEGAEDNHILSGTYSAQIPNIGAFSVNAFRTFGSSDETVVTVNLTVPLGPRTTASGRLQASRGPELRRTLEARHTAPLEGGFGAAASISENGFTRLQGEVSHTSKYGVATLGGSRSDGDNGVRATGVGGLAVADGGLFLSRRIDNSFAVASVSGQPGVRVYTENQLIGETDSNGRLLIHNLRAYEENRIRIEPTDLPIGADLETVRAVVAPRFRSGITVEFEVDASKPVFLAIRLEDGTPVPPGSRVTVNDDPEKFPVGFDGEVMVRRAGFGDRLEVGLGGATCHVILDREIPDEPIPDLGTFICAPGSRP